MGIQSVANVTTTATIVKTQPPIVPSVVLTQLVKGRSISGSLRRVVMSRPKIVSRIARMDTGRTTTVVNINALCVNRLACTVIRMPETAPSAIPNSTSSLTRLTLGPQRSIILVLQTAPINIGKMPIREIPALARSVRGAIQTVSGAARPLPSAQNVIRSKIGIWMRLSIQRKGRWNPHV